MVSFIPALSLAVSAALPQQQPEPAALEQPLFDSQDLLELELATDLRTLVRDIGKHVGDINDQSKFEREIMNRCRQR